MLADLLTILLTPYDDMGGYGGKTRIAAPRIAVGEKTTTVLALVVHEVSTNSLKYGAFSAPSGMLDVSCHSHNAEVVVVWSERGGPSVRRPTGPGGYGSKAGGPQRVRGHLGGSIDRDWRPDRSIVGAGGTLQRRTLDGSPGKYSGDGSTIPLSMSPAVRGTGDSTCRPVDVNVPAWLELRARRLSTPTR